MTHEGNCFVEGKSFSRDWLGSHALDYASFPTAVSFRRTAGNGQTSVSAILGAADRFDLTWTPRVKRAAEIAATVFCRNTALATFSGGVTKLRTTLDYQVTQGELKQLRVRLPAGQRLLRVEGASMRTWELKPDATGEILTVDLLKGVSPGYKLTLETERVLDPLPATVGVEIPHALDVKRETGLVALAGGEELALTVERSVELQRVDAEEFARATGAAKEGLLSAFRFLKAEFDLAVRVEAVQPTIEATIRNDFRVGLEQLSLGAQMNYTVKKAGVFALRLALPDGWRLDSVKGDNVQQWAERGDAGARVLEVSLKERTLGAGQLQVTLSQNWKDLPPALSLAGVAPLSTQKLSGYVTVTVELTYVGENKFPRRNGDVALVSPMFDVPLKNARWELFLPPDYDYRDFAGSMTRTADVGAPVVQDFSRSLYSEAETSKVTEKQKAMVEELSNVKQQLAEGKTREAVGNYNRAKSPSGKKGTFANSDEVEQLGKEVRRIQSSNLIQAQNAWYFENNARLNNGTADLGLNLQSQRQATQTDGEAEVAGKQWEKLEAAQQLAVTKVTPLHVNLPARGVRYSFTQVLQTEINKPMTIGLFAENTKTPSWLGRLAVGATVFGVLWILMSVVARRRGKA